MKKKALVLIFDGVEEVEAVTPIDLLRRAEIQVTVAAVGGKHLISSKNNVRLQADALLEESPSTGWDLLVVPGGPGHKALLRDSTVHELIRAHNASGGLIGSICAGPLVLKKAGVLENKRFTSFPATVGELPERDPNAAVVVDGNLITSKGAGTALPFALRLVSALAGPEVADSLAGSICAPSISGVSD